MAFRVLIAGPNKHFHDYRTLRVVLDALLAKRFPDVELLTSDGPWRPMLAASYAAERELPIIAALPECGRFPEVAAVHRAHRIAPRADAAVVVKAIGDPACAGCLNW